MAQNITLMGATYNAVPAVQLPKQGGGTAQFDDTTDANATAEDILSGKTAYVNGTKITGTGSGGGYDTSDATAAATDVVSGKVFYNASGRQTGSVTSRTSSDLSASGATVTAPAGFYGSSATKTISSGSATPASTISGTSASVSTGTNTLTLSKTVSNTPSVSAGYISSGTSGNSSVSLTASVTTKAAATITPGTSNQTISSGTYLTGTQTISGDANLTAGNIKSGTTIFGVTGTYGGGGGASNVVQGTFTTGSTGLKSASTTINYTGTGYPIALIVYVQGGAYNNGTGGDTNWYNSVRRYDVGVYYMTKSRTTTAPTYTTSGADNQGVVAIIYKNSTSTATTYTRTSSMTVNTYSSSNANTSTNCCRFTGDGKTLTYFTGGGTSSGIGLAISTTFSYIAIYSS